MTTSDDDGPRGAVVSARELRYTVTIRGDITPADGQSQEEADKQTALLLLPSIETHVRSGLATRHARVEYDGADDDGPRTLRHGFAEAVTIETDEAGFELHILSDDGDTYVWNVQGVAESLLDQSRELIEPWVSEGGRR